MTLLAVALLVVLPAAAKDKRLHGQGRLFEVSAAGVVPSYVFGTMHSTDPQILQPPTAAMRAFGKSTRLILELVFDSANEGRLQQAMVIGDGRTLSEIIGPALFSRLMARAGVYGLPAQHVNRLKPWAAGLLLSYPLAEVERSAAGAVPLDVALQRAADDRGMPVSALETIEEQVDALGGFAEKDQIAALRKTIELNPQIDALFAEMKEAYLAGDLDRLHNMSRDFYSESESRLAELFETRLIEVRNRRMANRLARHVKHGGAFVAIGALHLSGDKGVLHLLELRGYTVKRVE
jgi:uncharacterized protein